MNIACMVLGFLIVLIDMTDKNKREFNIFWLLRKVLQYTSATAFILVPIILKYIENRGGV